MTRSELITCSCGRRLERPIPHQCPGCGAPLVGIRRRLWPLIWPVLAILAMFGGLIVFLAWRLGQV